MVREEFIELLRTDPAFREEVRRQLLTEELLAVPGRLDHLTESVGQAVSLLGEVVTVVKELAQAQRRTEEGLQRQGEQIQDLITAQQRIGEQIQDLVKAQQRTEEELRRLVSWQWGEDGRRKGKAYEREVIRRAPFLFNGGQGGSADQPWVQQRLTELLETLLGNGLPEKEDDPFLADLLWWKGERIAVVEISLQVNGYDVDRAARRAATLTRAGAQALAVVIGDAWANYDAEDHATDRRVEWKIGPHLSEGFLAFRRAPAK